MEAKNTIICVFAALAVYSISSAQGLALENYGADCDVSYGALKANNPLPDPFAMNDGTRIATKEQWACRRNEVKKDLEQYEIGPKPDPSTATVAATLSGNSLSVKITTKDGNITLTSTVSGSGECVAIGMNGNAANISGCRQIPFMHDQVVTYANGGGSHNTADPFYKVYPSLSGKIGKYAAWSWGISRLIDGIEQVKDQLGVDTKKIGLQGCSYAGKMALFGGALDERVALTVAQESGGGGINSWRTSKAFTARTGTNIEKIDNTNFSWFLSSMQNRTPEQLPHDHHELIAMIAPRAVIALGNPGYEWLGDESGYKSVIAAKEVWKAFGLPASIGYDFTGGHNHCSAASQQVTSINAFVNKFLKGQSANTEITIQPNQSGFNLTTGQDVINWTTPTLTGNYPPEIDYPVIPPILNSSSSSSIPSSSSAESSSSVQSSSSVSTTIISYSKPLLSTLITVDIYDLKGNKVASTKVSDMSQVESISLPNGIYLAKARGMLNFKLVMK
ncbi:MAG: T9SS type A sorting domain-containing protein [Fibromonadales bacterium]|nr:T9SS type A sorting domain-containing protein [Fibromonadales bacterium]